MKTKTLLLLLLCAFPVAALWPATKSLAGPPSHNGGKGVSSARVGAAASGIALFIPQADTDFSELDVRDAQGNAVQSPSAKQELENLFRENIITLTVFASPHSMTATMSWLDSFSNLFNKLIFMRISAAFEAFQDIILPAQRRFVHNVHNLCATFSVGVSVGCLWLSLFTLQRSPRRLPLRC